MVVGKEREPCPSSKGLVFLRILPPNYQGLRNFIQYMPLDLEKKKGKGG